MSFYAIVCGLMLVVIGAFGYLNGTPEPETGKVSGTALIPLYFGAVLALCGFLVAIKDSWRKHLMHLAVLIGLVGALGGLMPTYRQLYVKNLPFDPSHAPVRNGLLMTGVCLLFVFLAVKSFIEARKARNQSNSR